MKTADYLIGGVFGCFFGLMLYAGVSAWLDTQEFKSSVRMDPPAPTLPEYGPAVGMTATFYGTHYQGRKTASGSIFNPEELTCATVDPIPFGTVLRVEYGPRVIFPVVTDRMPLDPTRSDRRLDLSTAAFRELAPLSTGVIRVSVRRPR